MSPKYITQSFVHNCLRPVERFHRHLLLFFATPAKDTPTLVGWNTTRSHGAYAVKGQQTSLAHKHTRTHTHIPFWQTRAMVGKMSHCMSDSMRLWNTLLNGFPIVLVMALTLATQLGAAQADSDFEEGFCAPYTGKVCRSFIRSSQVWFSRVDPNYGWENEKITQGLWDEMIGGLSGLCRAAAEVNLFRIITHLLVLLTLGEVFLVLFGRNSYARMRFRSASLRMVRRSSCRCATRTAWRRTRSSATMTGR